jgi:hypothetical protein
MTYPDDLLMRGHDGNTLLLLGVGPLALVEARLRGRWGHIHGCQGARLILRPDMASTGTQQQA